MKFSGPVQLCTSNFWVGASDQLPSRVQPWAINGLFLKKIYLLPEFLSYRGGTYLFGNLRTRAKKSREGSFGVGLEILGSECGPFFLGGGGDLDFSPKIDPPPSQHSNSKNIL
jgi:hypothetical protein